MALATVQPHPEWRVIANALSAREYGEVVAHAELANLTGLTYGTRRYFQQMQRARKTLLHDWRRELETVANVGYRLVKPDEFAGRSRRQVRLSGRRIRLASAILIAAPAELLTDDQNARNADALAKIGALESQRRRVIVETRPALPAVRADVPKMLV